MAAEGGMALEVSSSLFLRVWSCVRCESGTVVDRLHGRHRPEPGKSQETALSSVSGTTLEGSLDGLYGAVPESVFACTNWSHGWSAGRPTAHGP